MSGPAGVTQAAIAGSEIPSDAAPGASGAAPCPICGGAVTAAAPNYVYAIGRIEPRFPLLSVEKEFAQATGRAQTQGLNDRQTTHAVLTRRENRYLLRQLCWVMAVEGIETYILVPRDPDGLDLLAEALRQNAGAADIDVVIGVKGPIAPPGFCNGLSLPIVAFDQIYSFDRGALIGAIPAPDGADTAQFRATAEEVFTRVTQMADNAGGTDAHRALNYLAVRYPGLYSAVLDAHGRNAALTAVNVHASAIGGTRRIVDVIFAFNHRLTDVGEKYFVRVDVTEEFPFLLTKLSPYFDR